jgi:hypothetical protein
MMVNDEREQEEIGSEDTRRRTGWQHMLVRGQENRSGG